MAKRTITLHAHEGLFNPDEVMDMIETVVTCLTFIGGEAIMAVRREEVDEGQVEPTLLMMQYNTFVPLGVGDERGGDEPTVPIGTPDQEYGPMDHGADDPREDGVDGGSEEEADGKPAGEMEVVPAGTPGKPAPDFARKTKTASLET